MASLPRTNKELVDALRAAVQKALQERTSRMLVELPPGFDFGVEGKEKKGALTEERVQRSDRSLARLFVEMFDGTGLVPLVVFPTPEELEVARRKWGKTEAKVKALVGRSTAVSSSGAEPRGKKGKAQARKPAGFGAPPTAKASTKVPAALTSVPPATEVLFVVAPGSSQLAAVRSFCDSVGMDRLVVLLNPRSLASSADDVGSDLRSYFGDEFEVAYAFIPNPLASGGDGDADKAGDKDPVVLWRAFPTEWVLASKPSIGPPRTILSSKARPTTDEMQAALDKESRGPAGVLETLGNAFGQR